MRRLEVEVAGVRVEVHGVCATCQKLWDAADLEARLVKFQEELLRRSDAADRLRGMTLETYPRSEQTDAAMRVALDWLAQLAAGGHSNLYLWGDAGRGKSGLAWAITRRVVDDAVRRDRDLERLPAVFVNFRLLLARIKEGFGENERGETVSRYFGVHVLVIDDLGSERPTSYNRDELLNLIDSRYERQLPTIFTSNLRVRMLGERLSDGADHTDGLRIVSRIAEDMVMHEIAGRDLRNAR